MLPVQNLNEIKLSEKDWNYFARLNNKLLNYCQKQFDFTEAGKQKIVDYIIHSIKRKFGPVQMKETFIPEQMTYFIEFIYRENKNIFCVLTLNEEDKNYPNLIPGDMISTPLISV